MFEILQFSKEKHIFIRNIYVYVLLYAISICYVYLLCVLESCVVCICMYSCSKHDICMYMLLPCLLLCYAMLIVVLYLSVVYLLLRKTETSVIV